MTTTLAWRILQIADSAFPAGGFAHSAGLEATMHLGEVTSLDTLDAFVHQTLWNAGNASLPFVGGAYDRPSDVWRLNAQIDAMLTNHVANRASRTQGRSFVATCARVFDEPGLASLVSTSRTRDVKAHFAPLLGATLATLAVGRGTALALHLYLTLRGSASAAVRLGIVGPYEAQRLQQRHAATMDAVLERCAWMPPAQAATTAPLVDLFGATHERLYARLFQS